MGEEGPFPLEGGRLGWGCPNEIHEQHNQTAEFKKVPSPLRGEG